MIGDTYGEYVELGLLSVIIAVVLIPLAIIVAPLALLGWCIDRLMTKCGLD